MRVAIWAVLGALAVACAAGAAAAGSPAGHDAPSVKRTAPLLVGVNDEPGALYGDPDDAFQTLRSLGAEVLRANLYWGGTSWAVAKTKPADPSDPGDPAYDWTLYDRLVRYAAGNDVKVVFSILFTPAWANGGRGRNVAPTDPTDLE